MKHSKRNSENEADRIAELEEELAILRGFAELSSDWFWEQDAEFRFTCFYGLSPEKLRRSQSDFFGKRRWEMPIRGISAEELASHIAACQAHQPFHNFEYEVPGADGSLQHYSVSGMPFFDRNGRFCGYRGVGRNITRLRVAQRAILESERLLSQIVDGSPVPTFVIDAEHRVTHWNQACENLCNIAAAEIIGSTAAWRAFYDSPRPTMADLVVEGGHDSSIAMHYAGKYQPSSLIAGAYEAEDYFPNMKGHGCWLYFTAAPLHDSSGRLIGALETLQDVSARKLAEQAEREQWERLQQSHTELRQAMRQLVEAEKLASLGRLVAGIAHELNTPLGNAVLMASTLDEEIKAISAGFQQQSLKRSSLERFVSASNPAIDMLTGNLGRASRLVERFREVAANRHDDEVSDFSPAQVIDEVFGCFSGRLQAMQIKLCNDVSNTLVLRASRRAFEQIVQNLLDNALIHAFPERTSGSIRFSSEEHEQEVILAYSDDGCGMDEYVHKHAFDPFFTTKLGQGCCGLGLYLVHSLSSGVLGGRVEWVPGKNEGVCLRIILPQTDWR